MLRLFLLAIISIGHHVSFTPPVNPTEDDELHEKWFERVGIAMLTFSKVRRLA